MHGNRFGKEPVALLPPEERRVVAIETVLELLLVEGPRALVGLEDRQEHAVELEFGADELEQAHDAPPDTRSPTRLRDLQLPHVEHRPLGRVVVI